MMWPPSILRLRIHDKQHHFGLWLPLLLIWPFALLLGLLLLPLVLIAMIVLLICGWGLQPLLLGPRLFVLLCALRGLEVNVRDGSNQVLIRFL